MTLLQKLPGKFAVSHSLEQRSPKQTLQGAVPAASRTTHCIVLVRWPEGENLCPTVYFHVLRHIENELGDQLAETVISLTRSIKKYLKKALFSVLLQSRFCLFWYQRLPIDPPLHHLILHHAAQDPAF